MSNDKKDMTVVYANECNPEVMLFDEWYNQKARLYGCDDGAETLPADLFEQAVDVMVEEGRCGTPPTRISKRQFRLTLSAQSIRIDVV